MKSTIILVRHGQTYWNQKEKMQGQINIPLTERGKQQAANLSDTLHDYHFDICYASPLSRAVDTAKIVLHDETVPLITNNLLLEQACGLAEGTSYHEDLFYRFRPAYTYHTDPEHYVPLDGGETFNQLYERCDRIIQELLMPAAEQYRTILVASHGVTLCALSGRLRQIPLHDFWSAKLSNCGYMILEAEGNELHWIMQTSYKK
jgi:Fructose-2,6-bisphosphatase